MNEPLFQIEGLKQYFKVRKGLVKAIDDISFTIGKGETLSLVGESGCGKTTTGRTILGVYPPTEGTILYKGKDTSSFNASERKDFRKHCQMIFQDPYSCLDPRMTIGTIISEGLKVHFQMTKGERHQRVVELLDKVGLNEDFVSRFPHELSGGQRQRIGIARAMAVKPEFIVCDEPIAALDVSIQAQVINLMTRLQKEEGLTYLFISHDLSMVRHISDRIAVMYLGSIVELSEAERLYDHPLHPYTQALFSAIPMLETDTTVSTTRIKLTGEVPSPINPPQGCKFCTRCPYAKDICHTTRPELKECEPGHYAACHQL